MKVFVPMEKAGPRVYADARADSYKRSETHHMDSCSSGRVVPIYIRLFPRSAYIAVIYRAEDGAPIHMCRAEGRGRRLCIVQGRAQAFALGALVGVITRADQFALEEIPELFWCCSALVIILTGCHPMYVISAMFGVKKNEDAALITPTHPKSSNSPAITIHVTEGTTKPDREIYLTTRRQAIELKLDASENIKVRLVGGNALDEQSIIWAVDKSDVLSLVGRTGKEIIVRGLTSGTARLTVSHPDAALPLAITVNVRDAVRTLSLSRTRINMEASDTNKPLTLTIRGGFNTDYDDVTWESSDINVANIFGSGKNVTVNRRGVGQAVITATLPTTGQTAACNVTVLPDRYIIIPAGNIQVDRDVTTPTETEIRFHPSTLQISLTTNNTNASVVREGNKLKITGHNEGQTLLTATAGGGLGLKATLNITTYVTRDIIYPAGNINDNKPKEEFSFNYRVIPEDEKSQISFRLQYPNKKDISLTHNSAAGTLNINILKETNNGLIIVDPRKGGKGTVMIPINSSYPTLNTNLVKHGPNAHRFEEGWRDWAEQVMYTYTIALNIDPSVNVSAIEWSGGRLGTGGVPAGFGERTIAQGGGISKITLSTSGRTGTIKMYNDDWTKGSSNDTVPFYMDLTYTVKHGINGEKTYSRSIHLWCDPY